MTDTSRSKTDDRDEQTRDQDMGRDQGQAGGQSSDRPEEDTGVTTDQDLRDDL